MVVICLVPLLTSGLMLAGNHSSGNIFLIPWFLWPMIVIYIIGSFVVNLKEKSIMRKVKQTEVYIRAIEEAKNKSLKFKLAMFIIGWPIPLISIGYFQVFWPYMVSGMLIPIIYSTFVVPSFNEKPDSSIQNNSD